MSLSDVLHQDQLDIDRLQGELDAAHLKLAADQKSVDDKNAELAIIASIESLALTLPDGDVKNSFVVAVAAARA